MIHPEAPTLDHAVAWIKVEDAARADIAASIVAETRIEGIVHAAGELSTVAFALACPAPPPGRTWGIRAIVRAAGDRGGAPGDFHSVESVAIATSTGPLIIRVEPSQGAGRWPTPITTR